MDRFNRQRILSTFPQEHGVSVGVSFMWSTKQKSDNKNS